VSDVDRITNQHQLCIRARALHQRLPSAYGDAGYADVIARLAGVDEIVVQEHHDATGHAADAQVLHLLLYLDLLIVSAHFTPFNLAE
jgi:hypothetical protein